MSKEEFDKARFGRGDKIRISNEEYLLAEVDFELGIFGVKNPLNDSSLLFLPYSDGQLVR